VIVAAIWLRGAAGYRRDASGAVVRVLAVIGEVLVVRLPAVRKTPPAVVVAVLRRSGAGEGEIAAYSGDAAAVGAVVSTVDEALVNVAVRSCRDLTVATRCCRIACCGEGPAAAPPRFVRRHRCRRRAAGDGAVGQRQGAEVEDAAPLPAGRRRKPSRC